MIIQEELNGDLVNIFNSVSHAAKSLNFKRDLILRCCKGKQKTVKGFIFKYQ